MSKPNDDSQEPQPIVPFRKSIVLTDPEFEPPDKGPGAPASKPPIEPPKKDE